MNPHVKVHLAAIVKLPEACSLRCYHLPHITGIQLAGKRECNPP